MFLQRVPMPPAVAALGAREGPLSRVDQHVPPQVILLIALEGALRTREGAHRGVAEHVRLQRHLVAACVVTELALDRLRLQVHQHMSAEMHPLGTDIATFLA